MKKDKTWKVILTVVAVMLILVACHYLGFDKQYHAFATYTINIDYKCHLTWILRWACWLFLLVYLIFGWLKGLISIKIVKEIERYGEDNPFMKGTFNLTKQCELCESNVKLANELALEAWIADGKKKADFKPFKKTAFPLPIIATWQDGIYNAHFRSFDEIRDFIKKTDESIYSIKFRDEKEKRAFHRLMGTIYGR